MLRFSIIAAKCANSGIGFEGTLPWSLPSDMRYFAQLTRQTAAPYKLNAVIMGRKTFFSIPEKFRPLAGRINIVLSRNFNCATYPSDVILCGGLEEAMCYLDNNLFKDVIESVWVIGGAEVYHEAIESPRCDMLYITQIHKSFTCDRFFPVISKKYKKCSSIHKEDGIRFSWVIYKKITTPLAHLQQMALYAGDTNQNSMMQ